MIASSSITFFLFSYHILTLLYSLSCAAQVFTKYRLSFKLSKYDLFKDRVEYVGHDLTTKENCIPPTISTLTEIKPRKRRGSK